MANTLKQAVHDLFKDAKKSKSALQRLLKPKAEGAGSRVYPPRQPKKDEKYGIRIDKGDSIGGKVQLNLQINSNATKKSLKDLVRKNGSDKKYVTVLVDPEQEATASNLSKLEDQFLGGVDSSDAI